MHIRILFCSIVLAQAATTGVLAADWYTGRGETAATAPAATAAEAPADDNWIVAVDTSVSATSRNSLFANVVGTFAATGNLKETGPRVRVDGLAGTYNYTSSGPPAQTIRSRQMSGTALIGYEWVSRNTTAAIYVGATAQSVALSVPDPKNSVVGTGIGFKVSGEFYSRLTPGTMASGYASYSTLHNSYYSRLKYGFAILDDTYVGPEVSVLGDDLYRQIRAGVHVTGFRVAGLQFGVAGGYVYDAKQGSGAYGILDARFGF